VLANLHLIYGSDDFLVERKAREIVDEAVPVADRALGLETIDGRVDTIDAAVHAIHQCIEAVQTVGFFGTTKLVWLKNATFLHPQVRPGNFDLTKEAVAQLTARIKAGLPEEQRLLVTTGSVPRNTAFFKACQEKGVVSEFGGSEQGYALEKLARERLHGQLEKFNIRMSDDVRERFLVRTGTSTRIIVQELEKLRLYLGREGAEALADDVDAIVSVGREAEAWGLLDAVGFGDPAKMVRALRLLQSQEANAIGLVAMVEGRVRDLLVFRQAMDEGWIRDGQWQSALPSEVDHMLASLPRDPRALPPFIFKKTVAQAANYTLNDLRRARHDLINLREKLVSSSAPPDFLVETSLLRLIRRGSPARRASGTTGLRQPRNRGAGGA